MLVFFFFFFCNKGLHEEMDGKKDVVEFDFLGKDSIRYYNRVPVSFFVQERFKI